MNANELADELERPNNYQQENNFTTQAATMLRQQQAEIEALKAHPVKELTDEEITACMGSLPKYNSEIVDEDLVNFARAILRKAQEK